MTGYSSKVIDANVELTAKQRIMLKDTTDAIKLDTATKQGEIHIVPRIWGTLAIHNEKSEDKDYTNYFVLADDGRKFITGSPSFWNSFNEIISEMDGIDEEWGIKIYRVPSSKREGKDFITCSVE